MESKLGDNIDNNMIAQNLGTSQIFLPKNSVNTVTSVPQPVAGSVGNAPLVAPAGTGLSAEPPATSSRYFGLFGYEIPKMTVYIALVFLVLVGIYYYYVRSKSQNCENKEEKRSKSTKSKKSKKPKDEESSSESE